MCEISSLGPQSSVHEHDRENQTLGKQMEARMDKWMMDGCINGCTTEQSSV